MSKLSGNFSSEEFECKCGCGLGKFLLIDIKLIMLCEIVRILNGNKPTIISSGRRCPDHNKEVGGGPQSQHLYGKAADIYVDDPENVYSELCKLFPDHFGFGLYPNRVHVDIRIKKARWIKL
jgi:uncharacterized protein YcbK (DUF882 family)